MLSHKTQRSLEIICIRHDRREALEVETEKRAGHCFSDRACCLKILTLLNNILGVVKVPVLKVTSMPTVVSLKVDAGTAPPHELLVGERYLNKDLWRRRSGGALRSRQCIPVLPEIILF